MTTSARASRCARGIWASMMHVKKLAQDIIDEVPGLAKRASATLCCPHCIAANKAEPEKAGEITQFQLKILSKQVLCHILLRIFDIGFNEIA